MRFCPWDGTLLIVDNSGSDSNYRFRCLACPYVSPIPRKSPVVYRTVCKNKKVDDILGGADAWADLPQIDELCPECGKRGALWQEMQTRSADEPSTIFYMCVHCKKQWSEN